MLPILLMLAQQDIVARARELRRAEPACPAARDASDITVCGRREADQRYRVPETRVDLRDIVARERRLLPEFAGCGRVGGITTGCGFAGATVTRTFGGPGAKTSVKTRRQDP